MIVRNRQNVEVEISDDFYNDLKAVHGLDAQTICRMMYGKKVYVEKLDVKYDDITFTLFTDDMRDIPYVWKLEVNDSKKDG